jgi:hypothetical protein
MRRQGHTEHSVISLCISGIENRRLRGGGSSELTDGHLCPDSTAWAVLMLAAEGLRRALSIWRRHQNATGQAVARKITPIPKSNCIAGSEADPLGSAFHRGQLSPKPGKKSNMCERFSKSVRTKLLFPGRKALESRPRGMDHDPRRDIFSKSTETSSS